MRSAWKLMSALVLCTTLSASSASAFKMPVLPWKKPSPQLVTSSGQPIIVRPIKLKKGQYLEKQPDGKEIVKTDFAKAHPMLDSYKHLRQRHPVCYWSGKIAFTAAQFGGCIINYWH